ncbi:MAG TPA: imelysin family protein [Geminicoccaceae bacterium]|nr:imelysin family protein [Geminicoccus sp.]HMU48881.1 imelysin family protein [Geminicoccaceae bacterium]
MRRLLVLLILLLPAPVAARTDAEWTAFNLELARQYVAPRFEALAIAAGGLDEAAGAFCRQPAAEPLARLREAFVTTTVAWAAVEHLRTGPASIANRVERIYFWPERKNVTQRQLAALLRRPEAASLTAADLAGGSVAVQGLPALEMLIHGDEAEAALLAGDMARCGVVGAIASNVAAIAADLAREWSAPDGFQAVLDRPETPNPFFADGAEAARRLFNDLLTLFQLVGDVKLQAPMGESLDRARPTLTEGWRSGRSLRMIAANLASARAMFGAEGGFGLHSLLFEGMDSREIDREVQNAFDAAETALAAIPEPLDRAVQTEEGRAAVMTFLHHWRRARDQVAQRFGPTVGIAVGFNALDGD